MTVSVMTGCWAAMLSFSDLPGLPFDGAFVHDSPLAWIARNHSKPGRDADHETWVLHGSPEWSEACIDEPPEAILPQLIDAFWAAVDQPSRPPFFSTAHRWRYAMPQEANSGWCFASPELQLGACGDWCSGPRVENAFLSGMAMAGRVLCSP